MSLTLTVHFANHASLLKFRDIVQSGMGTLGPSDPGVHLAKRCLQHIESMLRPDRINHLGIEWEQFDVSCAPCSGLVLVRTATNALHLIDGSKPGLSDVMKRFVSIGAITVFRPIGLSSN